MVWLISLAFLLVSHGHEQLHEQPCAPDAHLPAKMSNPLPDGVGHQGWVSEPSLVIWTLPRFCFGILLLQLSMIPIADEFAGRVLQGKDA